MTFDTSVKVKHAFTGDRATIDDALLNIKKASGGTLLYASVSQALKQMARARNRKRALIVITDGLTPTPNAKKFRQTVRESETLIYTFGIRGKPMTSTSILIPAAPTRVALPPLQQTSCGRGVPWVFCGERLSLPNLPANQRLSAEDVLSSLAQDSRGNSTLIDVARMNADQTIEQMLAFVQSIAAELQGQYTLGYYSSKAGPASEHKIRVRVQNPEYHVRIRRNAGNSDKP
jgi:hypothetical protein